MKVIKINEMHKKTPSNQVSLNHTFSFSLYVDSIVDRLGRQCSRIAHTYMERILMFTSSIEGPSAYGKLQ